MNSTSQFYLKIASLIKILFLASALVEWLKETTLVRESPGSIPVRVCKLFSLYSRDVMINASITCLTLQRLNKVWWSDVKNHFLNMAARVHCSSAVLL